MVLTEVTSNLVQMILIKINQRQITKCLLHELAMKRICKVCFFSYPAGDAVNFTHENCRCLFIGRFHSCVI